MCKPSQPARRTAKVASLFVPVALLLALPTLGRADEPPPAEEVFRDNTAEVLQGAATLAGAGCQGGHGTAIVLALLRRGDQLHLWKLQEIDKALPLTPSLLKRVKDSTDIRVDDSAFEPEAYCEAVLKASLTSLGAFANSAHPATFSELFTDPWKYRGQVIHYEGTIRRIRHMDAPAMLRAKGINDLYECWMFGHDDGVNPVGLVCSELPAGVSPGEKLSLPASFDAYFFKRYRYQAVGSRPGQAREAPLFIGRSFVITKPAPVAEAEAYSLGAKWVLLAVLGLVLGTFVLAFGLHWWFRRNDRRVQARLKELRASGYGGAEAPEMPPGATPSEN